MLLLSKTYEVITPESAEHGDTAEAGFVFENEPYTFKDALRLAEDDGMVWDGGTDWLYTIDPDRDYHTGEETNYALHFSRANKPRARKYFDKILHLLKH